MTVGREYCAAAGEWFFVLPRQHALCPRNHRKGRGYSFGAVVPTSDKNRIFHRYLAVVLSGRRGNLSTLWRPSARLSSPAEGAMSQSQSESAVILVSHESDPSDLVALPPRSSGDLAARSRSDSPDFLGLMSNT